jgi:hypothetical protein
MGNISNLVFRGYIREEADAVIPVYLRRTLMHTQYLAQFGPYQLNADGSGLVLTPGTELATTFNNIRFHSQQDAEVFHRTLNASMGRSGLNSMQYIRPVTSWLKAAASILTMSLIVPKSFGDIGWQVAAGTDARERDLSKTQLWESLKSFGRDNASLNKHEQDIRFASYGLMTDSMIDFALDAMNDVRSIQGSEGLANALTSKFYRATGIHAWTNFMRRMALTTGELVLQDSYKMLTNAGTSEAEKAAAAKRFEQAGVTPEQFKKWTDAGKPTVQQALDNDDGELAKAAEANIKALKHHMDKRVAHVNQMDKTWWADHPIGSLAWMFKGFFYAVGNHLVPSIWNNMKDGNTKDAAAQIAYFAILGGSAAAFGIAIAHVIQYAVPAAITGNPLPPQAIMAMDPVDAAKMVAQYQLGGAFAAEGYSSMLTNPGGPSQLMNLMPPLSILSRFASNPTSYIDNGLEAAALMYAAGKYEKYKLQKQVDNQEK